MARLKIKAFKSKSVANKRFKREKMLWDGIYGKGRNKYYKPTINKDGIFWVVSWWDFN